MLAFPCISPLSITRAFLGAGCRHISTVHLLPLIQAGAHFLMQKRLFIIIAKIHSGHPAITSHPSQRTIGTGGSISEQKDKGSILRII